MRRIYRLKNPLQVMQEQARPICWFPLIGVSLPGFIYLATALLLILILLLTAAVTPFGNCMGCQ